MSETIIGKPISQEVFNQIVQRQTKISSPQRDNNILFFLNSNNAWVKLTSGVNTLTPEEVAAVEEFQTLEGIEGDSTLSQNSILGQNQNKGGISTAAFTGLDIKDGIITSTPQASTALYRNTTSRGFRPVPAITKVNVKSKGTYGTLRETEVAFVAWSLEDLDVLEAVYLRPGFSMLLEWGHTAYFTTDGEFRTATSTVGNFFTKYTTQGDESAQKLIQDEIDKLRVESNYNYDGLFGYVKNFSWSFRKDGGYDCTISIASVGSLIEGLRADVGLQNISTDLIDRTDAEEMKNSLKSPFHFIFEQLKAKNQINTVAPIQYYRGLQGVNYKPISGFFAKTKEIGETCIYRKEVTDLSIMGAELTARPLYYLHLSTVFDIINTYITLKSESGKTIEIYCGTQDTGYAVYYKQDYEIESKFVTSKYHFSVDPFRVHLPFTPDVPETIASISPDIKKYLGKIPERVESFQVGNLGTTGVTTTEYTFSDVFKIQRGKIDDILNIVVSSNVLEEIFDRNLEEPDSQNRDLKSLLDNLASILTDNLGGVNEFAFHFDETRNLYILVDRKNTPTESGTIIFPRLALTGLKSTVESISLSSKLSNRVSTQIAVAAQGSGGNYQENVSEILKWNRGVIDRHAAGGTFDTEDTTSGDSTEEYYRKLKWLTTAALVYKKDGSGKTYDPASFSELKPYHRIYMSSYVLDELIAGGQAEKGIIPVELSFTLLGISGIDIAESFKIEPGILPTRYSDRFGFIITGLEHEIGTRWKTTIRTQFYIVEPPSENLKTGKKAFLNPPQPADVRNLFTGGFGRGSSNDGSSATEPYVGPSPNADILRATIIPLGYLEKGREISSGGDITIEAAKLGVAVSKKIKQSIPGITVTFTGGNDLYHQGLAGSSRHKAGRGLDFVISNPTPENQKLIDDLLDRFVLMNDPHVRYINEYRTTTKNATGGHYHISWGDGTEAVETLQRVRKQLAGVKSVTSGDFIVTI
jgi:hypothetical protein